MKVIYKSFILLSFSVVLICISFSISASNFKYKQIKIQLDNEKGVPYKKVIKNRIYCIEGFDVDEYGNLYFLGGGENATLACFSDTILKFKRRYKDFYSSAIYISDDKLYLFDLTNNSTSFPSNSLYVLNKDSGKIINKYLHLVDNKVNSCYFRDTSLILEIVDNSGMSLFYTLFNLEGRYIKQVNNIFNLPEGFNFKATFIGEWNNNYLYSYHDVDKNEYIFLLSNKQGKLLATMKIDDKLFGDFFVMGAMKYDILRNGNIYVLGIDKTNILITILPIKDLFNLPTPR